VLGEVLLDDDVLFLADIGAIGFHYEELSLLELGLRCAIVDAVDIVSVISYLEPLLHPFTNLEGPDSLVDYLGLSTPVMMKGELALMSPSMYSLMLTMGIPDI
jgi:hypothetical protein